MSRLFVYFLAFLLPLSSSANNLKLLNGSFNGSSISFDIAWDNSWNFWNEGGSHDAVWVFIKGKIPSGQWVHIDINTEPNKHYAEILSVETPNDGKGIFLFSENSGTQNIPSTSITILTFDNLVDFSEIRVFGIEMVRIPQGEFYVGDGASISSLGTNEGTPYLITSENEISTHNIKIINPNEEFEPTPLPSEIPEEFPKGFASFYVMKYEISQIQYVDFLNTLTYTQQSNRTQISPSSLVGAHAMINPNQPDSLYRNSIVIKSSGINNTKPAVYALDGNLNGVYNEDSDGIHRAMNFLNWGDLSAYLDWAALRPITELEFEKINRGSSTHPVAGEFAWGTSIINNANTPINDGTFFEAVSEQPIEDSGLANHGNIVAIDGWGLRGVLRTGFAANESSTRLQAGASYYGVMEMSGNVWEQTIMVGGGGEHFDGTPGDGNLTESGNANQPTWCNPNTAIGVLVKGGAWGSAISEVGQWRDLAVSDRFYSHLKPTTRRNTVGGRGGR